MKKYDRRRFLVIGCGAACAMAFGAACSKDNTSVSAEAISSEETGTKATACPHGLVNDAYPGKCGRYVDKNGNGICDLSEVA